MGPAPGATTIDLKGVWVFLQERTGASGVGGSGGRAQSPFAVAHRTVRCNGVDEVWVACPGRRPRAWDGERLPGPPALAQPSKAPKVGWLVPLRHSRQKPHQPASAGNNFTSPAAITSTDSAARIRPINRVITLMPVWPIRRAIGLAREKHSAVASAITTP
jgi:hypothetical protein